MIFTNILTISRVVLQLYGAWWSDVRSDVNRRNPRLVDSGIFSDKLARNGLAR